jgi:hypothetical protein
MPDLRVLFSRGRKREERYIYRERRGNLGYIYIEREGGINQD